MLSAPRRSPAVPNHDGTRALFTRSTYAEGEGGKATRELVVMEISSGSAFNLSQDNKIHDANWMGDGSNTILYLRDGRRGVTRLMTLNADHPFQEPNHVADIPGPVKHMKLAALHDGSIAIAVCGIVGSDQRLHNGKLEPQTPRPQIFDSISALQSSTTTSFGKETIWFSSLAKDGEGWKLSGLFRNALRDTDLEVVSSCVCKQDEMPETNNYDVCGQGIVFVARSTETGRLPRDNISNVYYVPLDSFNTATQYKPRKLVNMPLNFDGYCSNPRFSPDGSVVGYIKAPLNSPVDTRIYLSHIGSYTAHDVFSKVTGNSWDLSPIGFEFSAKAGWLFIVAEDCGRLALYTLELQQYATPERLFFNGSVSGYYTLLCEGGERLLVSSSSFIESSLYQVIDIADTKLPKTVSSTTRHGAKLRLSHSQVSEFYYEGAEGCCVQAWMIKPPNFNESKKYPLALVLHDGLNGVWRDEWSTKWNLALWAAQGYVVVAPNITGSLGFGIPFATDVYNDWGGRPYKDIANCMTFLEDFSFIDRSKSIAAGRGYGGYLVNWIAGQPLAEKFRAFVTDNGMFGISNTIVSQEVPSITGGPRSGLSKLVKWNPSAPEYLARWRKPTLVIHDAKNIRSPLSEGIATFGALQQLQIPSRFLQIPSQDSQEDEYAALLERYRVMFGWVNKHIAEGEIEERSSGW
ncbi:prolyl oligopeptidase [Zalerion maritima]|uniref:Dipeptidyl-peptidase V n=1 Tax=Zalerion maritima TaxID=339359 RepID=A0AAD5WVK5_9PEZI|nr:prolyl oligopeptidase [Zalerion maritima]